MKPNLIDRLRCSPTLRQPSSTELATWAGDATWAGEAQPVSAAHGDSNDSVRVRPRCASLSLVLRQVEGEVQVLIIKRAVSLRDKWSGHIALPGGRQEVGESELQAAVRECQEEVGISLTSSRFELLGRLKDSRTGTSKDALTVSCFVFVQVDDSDLTLTIQASEVAFAWWINTSIFYPSPTPPEVGFAVTSMVKAARKPHWKALMWLFGAETIFFPCFFLAPPPSSGQAPVPGSTIAPTSVKYPLEATTFVLWGLTYGVLSDLAVAGGGRAFAHQGPPYFRFRSFGADFLVHSFYKLRRWSADLRGLLASSPSSSANRLGRD